MSSSIGSLNLEREYSPSLFTKRFQECGKPHEEVLKHFISISQNATTLAQQLYKTRMNVRYGGQNDNQLLDIYFKEHEQGTPIFVYIHGGFWQELDKSSSGPLVHNLVKRNYRVLLVDYDICPTVTLQQLILQISNFYKWLKIYAEKTCAPKISISGHSAGAHLALQLFENDFLEPLHRLQLIDHVFLISGLYDFRDLWPLQSCNPNNVLSLNADTARELSPVLRTFNNKELVEEYRKQRVKFHVLVAENDTRTFKQQSYTFAQMLISMKIDTVYHLFNSYDHFNIIEELINENSAISEYILCELELQNKK